MDNHLKFLQTEEGIDMKVNKAMVLGMARSGIAVAKLLQLRGAEVWVCDAKKLENFNGALDDLIANGAHLLLDETDSPVKVRDTVRFKVDYSAALRAFTSAYVEKVCE